MFVSFSHSPIRLLSEPVVASKTSQAVEIVASEIADSALLTVARIIVVEPQAELA